MRRLAKTLIPKRGKNETIKHYYKRLAYTEAKLKYVIDTTLIACIAIGSIIYMMIASLF